MLRELLFSLLVSLLFLPSLFLSLSLSCLFLSLSLSHSPLPLSRTEPKKAGGHIYNSVIGESQQNYAHAALRLREYIVFEQTAVYPEYKIFYRRVK